MNGDKTEIHDFRGRISRLEAHMEHMATKSWVLGGVVGGMVAAATVTLAVIKLFAQ